MKIENTKFNLSLHLFKTFIVIFLLIFVSLNPPMINRLIVTSTAENQTGWDLVTQPNYKLNDIDFGNSTHGIAVGEYGTILRTTDGGSTWNFQLQKTSNSYSIIPEYHNLESIFFINDKVAFITAYGLLFRTADSGLTWTYNESLRVEDITFIDETHGWCFTSEWIQYNTKVNIYKTEDGGLTWSKVISLNDYFFTGLCFIDKSLGWAWTPGGDFILKTEDGGLTWVPQEIGAYVDIRDIYFFNRTHGIVVGTDNILQTTTGGTQWILTLTASFFADFERIENFSEGKICVSGEESYAGNEDQNLLYRSLDCGLTWELLPSPSPSAVSFLDLEKGFGVNNASIVYTEDGGYTWQSNYIPNSIRESPIDMIIDPVDSEKTWLLDGFGTLFYKNSSSASWEVFEVENASGIAALHFYGEQLRVVDRNGQLFVREDGNFSYIGTVPQIYPYAPLTPAFTDHPTLWFVNETLGFVLSTKRFSATEASSVLYRTNDGGLTWEDITPAEASFRLIGGFWFNDELHGWMGGNRPGMAGDATVFVTQDSGMTWLEKRININSGSLTPNLNGICFVDNIHGWLVNYRSLLRTNDGGLTWTSDRTLFGTFLEDIIFLNSTHGWIVGGSGGIFVTQDGGDTWKQQQSPVGSSLSGIAINKDAQIGWIYGDYGALLHTTDGGGSGITLSKIPYNPLYGFLSLSSLLFLILPILAVVGIIFVFILVLRQRPKT